MKKLRTALIFILCIVTAFTFAMQVSAESIKYRLNDLGMTISIPDTMTVKTPESSTDLQEGIYLEAINTDSSLIISVSMVQNEETEKVQTFVDKPYSVLEEFKESMESLGFSEGKNGTYGGVPFLDFSQKSSSDSGLDIYTRHSVTLINGMSISIVSQSPGDNFTSDELSLLKSCLDSIQFDKTNNATQGVSFGKVLLWIFLIIIILALALLVLSYYMAKHNAEKKRLLAQERKKKADYDVLKKAEKKNLNTPTGLQGYKSSSAYFEEGFDSAETFSASADINTTAGQIRSKTEIAVKETKTAVTHMGYFFRNLKRELNKNKKNKNNKSNSKEKRTAVDYDIFSEK